ncbi:MAG TPA: hypothetical protein VNR89_04045 [Roseomonas sp.]|nr:hypothetical protein [Roseomonas sp.]
MTEATAAPAPEATPNAAPAAPAQVQSTAPESQTSERPGWLPEKFKSPEDLARAYSELEKKLSGAPKAPEAPQQQTAPEPIPPHLPDPSNLREEDANFILSQRGVSADEVAEEYLSKGKLSAETYEKLAKAGLPKGFVDGWIEGREAAAEKVKTRLFQEVGGEEVFTKVRDWALSNLSERELRAYNAAVNQGDVEVMALAVRGLHSRYIATVGNRPTLIGGGTAPSADGFGSQAEVVKAMSDPRYRNDPQYRAEVERKLAAKPVLNVRVTK